jgi:CRISPR-associated protein Cas1
MGKCAEKLIPICFISLQGRFLAKVTGEVHGNVFLRVQQIEVFRNNSFKLAQNTVASKISNTVSLINRSRHDDGELHEDEAVLDALDSLRHAVDSVYSAESIEEVLGIEGNCAKIYFTIFDKLLKNDEFHFAERSKRPPLDPVNAVLSFVYTLYTNEYASALETVGLDSYIGFYHALRSGRSSLACDMIEEVRAVVERFMITLINLGILNLDDFETHISGAVYLNENGRKKVLVRWQDKKHDDLLHPYLNQKIQFGLLPYVQSSLMAKYIRGEIDEYPCFLIK